MADNPLPKPSIPTPPPAPQQKSSGQGAPSPKPPGSPPPQSPQPGGNPTAPATPQVPRPPVVSQKTGTPTSPPQSQRQPQPPQTAGSSNTSPTTGKTATPDSNPPKPPTTPSATSQSKPPVPGQSQPQQVFSAPSAAPKPSTSSPGAPASAQPSHPAPPQLKSSGQSASPPQVAQPQATQQSQSNPIPSSPKPPGSPTASSPTPPKLSPTTSGVSAPSPSSSAPAPKPTASAAQATTAAATTNPPKPPTTPRASSPANPTAGSPTTPAPTVARPPSGLSAHSSMTSTNISKSSPPPVAPPPPAGQVAGKTTPPTNTTTQTTTSTSSDSPAQPAQPTFAKSGFSLSKKVIGLIIAGLALLGIIGVIAWLLIGSGGSSTDPSTGNTSSTGNSGGAPARQVSIEYWGLWEPTEVMQEVFADFQRQNPGVVINYRKQSAQDYRTRLQTAIAGGNGPDVFRFHASWVPMLSEELAPLPNSVMSSTEYQKTFYPIATYQLQNNSQIVGIPLMYDGLALYYNKKIFETADIEPPQTWSELQSNAVRLTVRQNNRIQRAGIAMGNAANTEHFSDIIGLLMLQNGADFNEPNSAETRDALLFYVNFVKQLNVWDSTLPSSTVAFAREEAAMMIAPSWRSFEVDQVNPNLEYGIAPLPQLPDATRFTWGTYWAEGVNSKGTNKEISWKLLKYMSSPEVLKKLHAEQAKTRSFGEIYPRVDMAEELAGNEKIRPFLQDAPYAQSWYINSYTHDAGLNDQLIKYYEDAVNALLQGEDVEDVLETLDAGTQQVARQYSGN